MIISEGQTAVITGAASGIGLALCHALSARGVNVVMADVNDDALGEAATAVEQGGRGRALPVACDVSSWESVEQLAERAHARFGDTHLLFNNAGVIPPRRAIWETPLEDWRWVFDVDVFGVVHGIRAFVPKMIEAGQPGHVVNTASIAGLLSYPLVAPYAAAKHAVVAITEALRAGLADAGAPIGASVLCPGLVATALHDTSNRLRPLGEPDAQGEPSEPAALQQPEELAAFVLDRLSAGDFWLLPHDYSQQFEAQTGEILGAFPPVG